MFHLPPPPLEDQDEDLLCVCAKRFKEYKRMIVLRIPDVGELLVQEPCSGVPHQRHCGCAGGLSPQNSYQLESCAAVGARPQVQCAFLGAALPTRAASHSMRGWYRRAAPFPSVWGLPYAAGSSVG
eukprot:1883866-Amphidinium_carterae.1